MKLLNIFFKMIKIIGPTNIPITPINLNPVYIAIIVKIGCMPIFPTNDFGLNKLPYKTHNNPQNNYSHS